MERYISNKILGAIYRPQPHNLCAIQSLRTVFKVLKDIEPPADEIIEKAGLTTAFVEAGRVGNERMVSIAENYGIALTIFDSSATLPVWSVLIEWLKRDVPLIFHREGHYCNLCGFIEEPFMIKKGDKVTTTDKIQKWLVIADHRVKYKTDVDCGMIELFSWANFKKELDKNPNTALLVPSIQTL